MIEAVFFAYSYITMNSQTERTSLLFCWGPSVGVTRQQADGSFCSFLAPGKAPAIQEVRAQREQGMVMLPGGTLDVARTGGAFIHQI